VSSNGVNGVTKHHPTEADARVLEHNIDEMRDHLGDLLSELNRRRRDAMNLRLQLQRRPAAVVLAAVAVVGAIAGLVALAVTHWHRRRSLVGRAGRMRVALRRIAAHPELLAEPEATVSHKIAAAGGTALASVLAKQLAKRLVST
jgi:hypothetical protein